METVGHYEINRGVVPTKIGLGFWFNLFEQQDTLATFCWLHGDAAVGYSRLCA